MEERPARRREGSLSGAAARGSRRRLGVGVLAFGVLGALCYLSWPIGYLVNHGVVVGGLASDLEVPGQPDSWLFIGLDIISGLAMLGVTVLVWGIGPKGGGRPPLLSLVGYGAFGVSSILSAAVPLSCGTGRAALLACGTTTSSYGWHDVLSFVGYLAFFVTLVGAVRRTWPRNRERGIAILTVVVSVLWCIAGVVFMAVTLAHVAEVPWQHVLLALTTLAIAVAPFSFLPPHSWTPRAPDASASVFD